jgi:hypothetical protein
MSHMAMLGGLLAVVVAEPRFFLPRAFPSAQQGSAAGFLMPVDSYAARPQALAAAGLPVVLTPDLPEQGQNADSWMGLVCFVGGFMAASLARPMMLAVGGEGAPAPEEVELASECGLDYTTLRDLLAAGEYQKADDETRAKLIEMAGPVAVTRGYVYFAEVKNIPATDLQTVDRLWQAYSDGKFGYSVQKKAYEKAKKQFPAFFKAVDWTTADGGYRRWPDGFFYHTEAKPGHLPLTNTLRGTRLLAELFEHPAFQPAEVTA